MSEMVISERSLNAEQLRISLLQQPPALFDSKAQAVKASSIKPASVEPNIPQFRPALEPPRHPTLYATDLNAEMEEVTTQQTHLYKQQIESGKAELKRLEEEKEAALKKEAAAAKSRGTWNILLNVSQYLLSTSSIVLGLSLTGGVAAGAGLVLAASGVVGLADRALHDSGALQAGAAWFTHSVELQQKKIHQIETGMFYFSMGLGLAGGIWAYQAGAFALAAQATRDATAKKATEIIGVAGGTLSVGGRFGKAFGEKGLKDAESDRTVVEARITKVYHGINGHSMDAKRALETTSTFTEEARKAIAASEVQLQID